MHMGNQGTSTRNANAGLLLARFRLKAQAGGPASPSSPIPNFSNPSNMHLSDRRAREHTPRRELRDGVVVSGPLRAGRSPCFDMDKRLSRKQEVEAPLVQRKDAGDGGERRRENSSPERGGQVFSPGDSVRLEVLPVGLSSEAMGFKVDL